MLHYDAILFDVDGTLIDSAPGILHTLEEVFQKMGVDVTGVNLRRYLGPPLRKSFGEHFSDKAKIEEAAERYRASIKQQPEVDNITHGRFPPDTGKFSRLSPYSEPR